MSLKRLARQYELFALEGQGGTELIDSLWLEAKNLGICDPALETIFARAYSTDHPLDVERAKELFHSRLKKLSADKLGDIDPHHLFTANTNLKPWTRR